MFRRTRAIETNRATKGLLSEQMAKARGSHYNNHGWARGRIMPSFKDADLAAIKARYKSNYALITNDPKIANDPVIIAALAKAKASEVRVLRRARKRRSQKQFTPEVGRVSALPPSRYGR